jgi:acetylornithine deacetylase/succinyl-diaminopimelate desuccinylase-like protein
MTAKVTSDPAIYLRPEQLLQNLIRFDTTNPPGNEGPCIGYLDDLLRRAGFETTILAADPQRPNLIARLEGKRTAPPLLFYGHADVVTTANQEWTYPPFAGKLVDGFVWGRGALDMKGGLAMMVAAFLRARAEGLVPAGDIVLAILSDEEATSGHGAKFLVENHAERFQGVRYAIGEFGGFPMYVAGQKFYAIQVAEKQVCWLKAKIRGPGGHGSLPMRGGTMARLGDMLQMLDKHRLPVHITPIMRQMLETMATTVPAPANSTLLQLLDPDTVDQALDALGHQGLMFDALLHNTINVTVVQGGQKVNVIPSEIGVQLDGRLLPGCTPDDLVAELHGLLGREVQFELLLYSPGPGQPDMGWFDTLAAILRKADPAGIPVPLLLFGSTDAHWFSKLGIQTYGFLPMNLPAEFDFLRRIHAADERIPVESVAFGADAIYEALQSYGY